jgi:hypothetical protein
VLQEAKAGLPTNCLAVLKLFDNVSYYAVTLEATVIPSRKDPNDCYHVDGDLLLAPPEVVIPFYQKLSSCLQQACWHPQDHPLPSLSRNVTRGCCNDTEHAPNRWEDNFWRKITSGEDRSRNALRDHLQAVGVRKYMVLNPRWLIAGLKASNAALEETMTASGQRTSALPRLRTTSSFWP